MWWSTQPSHGVDAATYRAMSQDQLRSICENSTPAGTIDRADHRCRENIVVTDTLDVATLPTWSRKRTL